LFEPTSKLTNFNLTNPLLVATYDGDQIPERWNAKSRGLENLLFRERGIERRLRTARRGVGHAKLNLLNSGGGRREGRSGEELRDAHGERPNAMTPRACRMVWRELEPREAR
jgi:hypothetical protein